MAAAAALAILGASSLLSIAWGGLPDSAWQAFDESLIAGAALVVGATLANDARRADIMVGGVGVGLTCLALELLYRLQAGAVPAGWIADRAVHGPVGYHNAQAAFFAAGIPIAIWASSRRSVAMRISGGCALGLLEGALLLTQSRGAVVAVCLGVVVQLLVVRDLRLLALTVLAALVGVGLLFPLRAVDASLVSLPGAGDQGAFRRFAAWVLVAAAALAMAAASPPSSRVARRVIMAVAGIALIASFAFAVVTAKPSLGRFGTVVDQVVTTAKPEDLPAGATRFRSLSLSSRPRLWTTAFDAYRTRPLTGIGSGEFAREWGVRRWTKDLYVLQPHSLELEVLTENGLFGFAALLAFVATVVVGLARSRSSAYRKGRAGAAAAAFTVLIAQASIDWTFSFPALVAAIMLIVGAAMGAGRSRLPAAGVAVMQGLAALAVIAALLIPYFATKAVTAATEVQREQPARAWQLVSRARDLDPWSEAAVALQGLLAESAGRYRLAARVYGRAAELAQQPWIDEYRRARALREAGLMAGSGAACRLAQEQNPLEPVLRQGACARRDVRVSSFNRTHHRTTHAVRASRS